MLLLLLLRRCEFEAGQAPAFNLVEAGSGNWLMGRSGRKVTLKVCVGVGAPGGVDRQREAMEAADNTWGVWVYVWVGGVTCVGPAVGTVTAVQFCVCCCCCCLSCCLAYVTQSCCDTHIIMFQAMLAQGVLGLEF